MIALGAFGLGIAAGALLLLIGMGVGTTERRGKCSSCRHGLFLHDPYSGKCAGKVNTAWWLARAVGGQQLAACKCVAPRGATA